MSGVRWVHFARPWTQESKPALTDSSLAGKRRAEALHVVCCQPSIRAQHDDLLLLLLLLCVYCRMIRGHERGSLGALLFLVSRSEPASTDSWLSGCGEARRLRSRIAVVFVLQRIDRYSYMCMYLVLLL